MKKFTKYLIGAVLFFNFHNAAFCQEEYVLSGNWLYNLCNNNKTYCFTYIVGYTRGIYDIGYYDSNQKPEDILCIKKKNITFEQMTDVVTKYIKNNPQERHKYLGDIIFNALQKAFCEN